MTVSLYNSDTQVKQVKLPLKFSGYVEDHQLDTELILPSGNEINCFTHDY